jgi:acetyl esterase/lipase
MDLRLAHRIAAIGDRVAPEQAEASREVYADLHERPPYAGVRVVRDLAYGSDDRHRLDVFASEEAEEPRPVLVFVHGGGFVRGEKSLPGTPYHDNVGLWACRSGLLGVTMSYRLAPAHRWPAGAEDVGAAVAWLRDNVGGHGGDPERIVLMGASAGATHVAGYAGLPSLHRGGEVGIRGVVLLSGAYDLPRFDDKSILEPYFGSDAAGLATASPLPGLVASRVPALMAVAEHDPPVSHGQAAALFAALYERDRRVPRIAFLPGHNHFTEVLHLNAVDDVLSRHVLAFVDTHARAGAEARSAAAV